MTQCESLLASASRQHGIMTRTQARGLGASDHQVDRLLRTGVFVPLHPGVYRYAGAPPTRSGRALAAVLAAGPGAVASHRSAAVLHDLRDIRRWRPEVTVCGSRLPVLDGVTCHRTTVLEPVDVTTRDRVPVTTIARTLLDLGAVVPAVVVELAAQDAIIREAVTLLDLVCLLDRLGRRGRSGTAALRAVTISAIPTEGIESRLEFDLWRIIESSPIPRPVLQHEVVLPGGLRVRLDAAWPDLMVVAQSDGRRWHATRREFEHDLRRSRAITAAGWDLYRYGWADVHQRPAAVRAELTAVVRAAMAARAA